MAEEEESLVERICRLEREKEILTRQVAERDALIRYYKDVLKQAGGDKE